MIDKKLKKREEIPPEYKWDIESMYPDEREWKKEYARAEAAAEAYAAEFAGKLSGGGGTLLAALRKKDALWLIVERLFVYAKMRRDEDNRNAGRQAMADRAQALIARVSADLSFFAPEFLAIPEETLRKFAEEEQCLGQYGHLVRTLLRQKEHVLPRAEEELLARLSDVTSATGEIFSMINEADMKFGAVTGEDGEETELTHGRYIGFMESRDRKVRREAFSKMYGAYIRQKNTLAATYRYNTKADTVIARIRGYSSSLEAALSGDNIPLSVYDSLIGAVNGRLGALHRYMDIRKKILGVDELHMYDVYAPLVEREEKPVRYERAVEILRRGLSALGGDYVKRMERGLSERWVDVYENEGKTSGAYSFGSYDSKPYILLNYTGKLKDVFTLAHEMGHSMHSAFTRENQPFVYGGHSIFTAEVASTVNESLLMRHLLAETPDTAEKKYLLNLYIEEFRATLFRQAMFAEFEKLTHAAAERGESLTSDWLCGEYGRLNEKYFGPSVKQDEEIAVEWARIPHFYRAFYVYKYATGYSAAVAIADRILNEGESARDAYIDFLKTGESGDPIDLLKIAGVDMSAPEPVERAIDTFEGLVDEMEKLFI
ncbi:MAG: oligoendopeptidase F [Clostridiales Family XIII bacterium]|nr:oligoendopeptidase F [Clostridiales Family XIII bacterium]